MERTVGRIMKGLLLAALPLLILPLFLPGAEAQQCKRTLTADVVALDQPIWCNRVIGVSAGNPPTGFFRTTSLLRAYIIPAGL